MKNFVISSQGAGVMLNGSFFTVPMFQRSYAWKKQQINNLLTDLVGAIQRKHKGRADTYFLGTIVLVDRGTGKPLEVVDGQQRLATISILLAAIRDYHWEIEQDRAAESYDEQFLRKLHVPTGKRMPKLKLNEIDNRCFVQEILTPPKSRKKNKWTRPSHLRLIEAYQYTKDFVDTLAKYKTRKEVVSELYEIVEFLRSNVQAIHVLVDDEADAFTVFETLNDRHLPLTVADLLKNFLFGMMSKSGLEEAKSHWAEMQGALSTIKGKKDRIVDFIRQLWGSRHGLVREKELFRDIKNHIVDEDGALALSGALADQATHYVAVLDDESDLWSGYGPAAAHAIETFNVLRVERIRPLLLAILDKFERRDVLDALDYLRAAAVRIIVTTGVNGTVEEKIYEVAVQVHKGQIENAAGLAKAMNSVVANDAVFRATFETMFVTQTPRARFYLHELEEIAKGDDDEERETRRDGRRVTLEHIIPESAEERRKHWSGLTPEEGAELCKRFGNMTLLLYGPNSRLNGKGYAEKRVEYGKCEGIYLTKHINDDYDEWGAEQVEDRQKKLAAFAVQRWPIKVPVRRQSGKRGS